MTKFIELHSRKYPGLVALVDDADFTWINEIRWNPAKRITPGKVNWYAVNRGKNLLMHKLITGGRETDHIDHDGLNNQRSNLRISSRHQNEGNARKWSRPTSSAYKGVSRRGQRWRAYIKVNYKQIHIGYFDTEYDAAQAYNTAATEAFGSFALLNKASQ